MCTDGKLRSSSFWGLLFRADVVTDLDEAAEKARQIKAVQGAPTSVPMASCARHHPGGCYSGQTS